jgi:hypothetical protein
VSVFVKRRGVPEPDSIPAVLGMFTAEVRFYQEIAPVIGIRVPACYRAESTAAGTLLELEDLSAWQPGADPVAAARLLATLHLSWSGWAASRWPWLRPLGAAIDLVADLYDRTWPQLRAGRVLPPDVIALGTHLSGNVVDAENSLRQAGPLTLTHGDASMPNMRTGPDGEIALLDWEDAGAAPGAGDLAWLLVSSVAPERWDDVIAAYAATTGQPADPGVIRSLPSAAVQGLLSMADCAPDSADSAAWLGRLQAAARRLDTGAVSSA